MKSPAAWVCVSWGSCAASFVTSSLPYLQWAAVLLSIAAGLKAIFGKKQAE